MTGSRAHAAADALSRMQDMIVAGLVDVTEEVMQEYCDLTAELATVTRESIDGVADRIEAFVARVCPSVMGGGN